jgi:hypothetical protein
MQKVPCSAVAVCFICPIKLPNFHYRHATFQQISAGHFITSIKQICFYLVWGAPFALWRQIFSQKLKVRNTQLITQSTKCNWDKEELTEKFSTSADHAGIFNFCFWNFLFKKYLIMVDQNHMQSICGCRRLTGISSWTAFAILAYMPPPEIAFLLCQLPSLNSMFLC